MLIECDTCPGRGSRCGGCLVTALAEPPVEVRLLGREELLAIEMLARAGFEVSLLEPPAPRRSLLRVLPNEGQVA